MDLHPRDGKYGHAAAWPLVPGRRLSDGTYQRPLTAIVANLPRPGGDLPALLRHADVVTLFHEFGHVLHMTLTRAELVRFSGAQHGVGLRRGAEPDPGALGLAGRRARPVRPSPRDRRAHPARPRGAPRGQPGPGRCPHDAAPVLPRPDGPGASRPGGDPRHRGDRSGRLRCLGPALPRGHALPVPVRAPDGRLRRRLLRLPLVEGLRRRHVRPLRGGGHHLAGHWGGLPARDPRAERDARRHRDAAGLPGPGSLAGDVPRASWASRRRRPAEGAPACSASATAP